MNGDSRSLIQKPETAVLYGFTTDSLASFGVLLSQMTM